MTHWNLCGYLFIHNYFLIKYMALLEKDKRKFRVIIGSKKCGMCYGTSPSLAAKKVKEKSGAFYLKEITKDSKKKLYGPYSSKKGVVQRGGNPLREQICEDILAILKNCDNLEILTETQKKYNREYDVLNNSYLFLNIDHREKDKCSVLKGILIRRNSYHLPDGRRFPLDFCLYSLKQQDQVAIERAFLYSHYVFMKQYFIIKNKDEYYKKYWSNFITVVLRRTINLIEIKIIERERRSNARLAKLKNEFNEEREKITKAELDQLKKELKEAQAQAFHAAQEAGPANAAEENSNNFNIGKHKGPPSYLLTNNELRELGINPNGSSVANQPTNLSKIPPSMLQPVGKQQYVKPKQPVHNNQKPAQGQPASTNNNEAEKQRRHENLLRQLEELAENNS